MSARTLYVAEPPARYFPQAPLVVDCSVIAAIVFDEDQQREALALVAGKSLVAPFILDSEVASVALKKTQTGATAGMVAQAMDVYEGHDIELHPTDARGQIELAQRYSLSAYDAAYLWLASAMRIPLLTFDKKLARAAREHLAGLA